RESLRRGAAAAPVGPGAVPHTQGTARRRRAGGRGEACPFPGRGGAADRRPPGRVAAPRPRRDQPVVRSRQAVDHSARPDGTGVEVRAPTPHTPSRDNPSGIKVLPCRRPGRERVRATETELTSPGFTGTPVATRVETIPSLLPRHENLPMLTLTTLVLLALPAA